MSSAGGTRRPLGQRINGLEMGVSTPTSSPLPSSLGTPALPESEPTWELPLGWATRDEGRGSWQTPPKPVPFILVLSADPTQQFGDGVPTHPCWFLPLPGPAFCAHRPQFICHISVAPGREEGASPDFHFVSLLRNTKKAQGPKHNTNQNPEY